MRFLFGGDVTQPQVQFCAHHTADTVHMEIRTDGTRCVQEMKRVKLQDAL